MWLLVALCGALMGAKDASKQNDVIGVEAEPNPWQGKTLAIKLSATDFETGKRAQIITELVQMTAQRQAAALVFEINTPPGYDADRMNYVLSELRKISIPTVAYVDSSAFGPGALIAVGCDQIYLSPVGAIGGAMPNLPDEGNQAMISQTVGVLKAKVRSLAVSKGHSAKIVDSFVDPLAAEKLRGRELKEGDSAEVLTLTAAEASQPLRGEPALARGICRDLDEVLERAELPLPAIVMSPAEWRREEDRRFLRASQTVGAVDEKATSAGLFERDIPAESYAGKILVLKIGNKHLISKARFEFMERVIERARESGAVALILDMDTPGGVAWWTSELILRPFQDLPFPTYTFVNPNAQSAGSIIAVATDHIYMRPTSTIGSALLVTSGGADLNEDMQEKVEQMFRAAVRNVAAAKGHDPDVAEAFVTRKTEVVKEGVTINKKGEVLNLNALEATKLYGEKPLLAKGIARSVEEIVEVEGLQGELVELKPLVMESIAEWIQLISVVLIVVGVAGAYLELNAPGFGVAGFVSIAAFTLFFFGNYMAGNLVGYGTAVLFAIGFLLVVLEFLVIPGTFVAGTVGLLMMLGALGSALIKRVDFEEFQNGETASAPNLLAILEGPAFILAIAILLTIIMVALLMRVFPAIGLFRGLVLENALPSGETMESDEGEDVMVLRVGDQGRALTDLRPGGKVEINGRMHDVSTQAEFVPRGAPVEVIKVTRGRITVKQAS